MRENLSERGPLIYKRVVLVNSRLLMLVIGLSEGGLSEVWKEGMRWDFDDLEV
jgi:hypothetical protein